MKFDVEELLSLFSFYLYLTALMTTLHEYLVTFLHVLSVTSKIYITAENVLSEGCRGT
jgi:hypothetical protein